MTDANVVPTIQGLPWLGVGPQLLRDPLAWIEQMVADYPDIVRFRFFGGYAYQINAPELVRDVLVTHQKKFRKADAEVALLQRVLGNGLLTNNDYEHHRGQRQLVQPAFHARRIASYADTIVAYTAAMLAAWPSGAVVDVSHEMRDLTMYIVAKTLFDADRDDLSGDARAIGEAIEVFQTVTEDDFGLPFLVPEWLPTPKRRELRAAKRLIDDMLRRIIADRRAHGTDQGDLLSMLLEGMDSADSRSERQLLDEVITLFVAGHETTSNALTWTWLLLARNPDVAARLHAEADGVLGGRLPTLADLEQLPYTLMVLKEAMRLYPPAWSLNGRMAQEDVPVGDYVIAKDSYVLIPQWGLHHNPRLFPDPWRFDPERFSAENEPHIPRYAYLPFGAGPRVCIGNSFAMMEAHLILATVAQRFALHLMPDQTVRLNPQITLSNKGGMRMRLDARQPAAQPVP